MDNILDSIQKFTNTVSNSNLFKININILKNERKEYEDIRSTLPVIFAQIQSEMNSIAHYQDVLIKTTKPIYKLPQMTFNQILKIDPKTINEKEAEQFISYVEADILLMKTYLGYMDKLKLKYQVVYVLIEEINIKMKQMKDIYEEGLSISDCKYFIDDFKETHMSNFLISDIQKLCNLQNSLIEQGEKYFELYVTFIHGYINKIN